MPQNWILGPLLFLICISDMPQAVDSELILYAYGTCLAFQHTNIKSIEEHLNRDFSTFLLYITCWWEQNKMHSLFLNTYIKINRTVARYLLQGYQNKTLLKGDVSWMCLGWMPNRESMTMQFCIRVTSKLQFLYLKNRFLSKASRRLLCNPLIQRHFDYVCVAWYPNLNKKYKNKL